MKEVWKPIKGYEGLYEISNFGKVISLPKKGSKSTKILKLPVTKSGYNRIGLRNKTRKYYFVHRLVAEAFIPNPNYYPFVNHIDGIKTNNCVNNLEWCTQSENMLHAYKIGLKANAKGSEDNQSKTILQKNDKGEIVKKWGSSREIQRELGFNQSHIIKCCKKIIKKSYGYIWLYESEVVSNE